MRRDPWPFLIVLSTTLVVGRVLGLELPGPHTPKDLLAVLCLVVAAAASLLVLARLDRPGASLAGLATALLAGLPALLVPSLVWPRVGFDSSHWWPSLSFLGWGAAGLVALALPAIVRRGAVLAWVLASLAGVLLAFSGARGVLAAHPLASPVMEPPWPAVAPPGVAGVRVGAPVADPQRIAALAGEGTGWWAGATRAEAPPKAPLVLLLDGLAEPDPVFAEADFSLEDPVRFAFRDPLALDPYDVLIVGQRAWGARDGRANAEAVRVWVHRGGLLIGPAGSEGWPPNLARAIQAPRVEQAGTLRRFGLGRVLPVAGAREAVEAIESGAWGRDVGTVFDRARHVPSLPAAVPRWTDRPAERRPGAWLLLGFAGFALLLGLGVRQTGTRLVGLVVGSLLTAVGLTWLVPPAPALEATPIRLELGGRDGRRTDVVVLSAGPTGWRGRVTFQGRGIVSVLGADLDPAGRVVLRPGGLAVALRRDLGQGGVPPEAADRMGGELRGLLVGAVDPKRLRYGRGGAIGVRVEGVDLPEARVIRLRAP